MAFSLLMEEREGTDEERAKKRRRGVSESKDQSDGESLFPIKKKGMFTSEKCVTGDAGLLSGCWKTGFLFLFISSITRERTAKKRHRELRSEIDICLSTFCSGHSGPYTDRE